MDRRKQGEREVFIPEERRGVDRRIEHNRISREVSRDETKERKRKEVTVRCVDEALTKYEQF